MPSAVVRPEYRKDPLSESWVIISPERSARPEEFREFPVQRVDRPCPFCAGNEAETPAAVALYPARDWPGRDWNVRVVPNKYPALLPFESHPQPALFLNGTQNLCKKVDGVGSHELIIESRTHAVSLTDIGTETLHHMFHAYRDRMQAMREQGWSYAQIFKNVGAAAGSSIEHAHSQLVGMPMVPLRVRDELEHSRQYFQKFDSRLLDDMRSQELASGERIVQESAAFVAFCPFASRFPFEMWVMPKEVSPRLESVSTELLEQFAHFMRELVARLERLFTHPAYNYVIHSAPFDGSSDDHFQWHLELLPRLTKTAGFEWGTGCYINPVSPEQAAMHLRSIAVNVRETVEKV